MIKMFDDILYYSSLIVCISLGSQYKRIEEPDMQRNYGAGLGILVACVICGHYVYHTILMVWGNIIIIKCCDKNYVHQMSFGYTWIYLLYLHFNLSTTIYVIWLHQILALRLVGLAFDVHFAEKAKSEPKASSSSRTNIGDIDNSCLEPTAIDIITYAYFFVGLHKGPYYRWKIFNDQFKAPYFGAIGDCRIITDQKLKKAGICALGYSLLRLKYSPEIYYSNEFYNDYDADIRYLYNIPQLTMYFLQCQILMLLSTSVATQTGFGVYPAKSQPLPGHGPSIRYNTSMLKLTAATSNTALEQEYNFSTLKCYENEKVLLGPRMKDTLRSWNMPTRYWFWSNFNRSLLKSNKEIRSACSFLAWTLWSDPSLRVIIISSTLWVYVHLETEYSELYNTTGSMKMPWDIGFSIMRMFCLIYLTPCFIVHDSTTILRYYNSIFWVYHIILIVLIIGAIVIYKSREE